MVEIIILKKPEQKIIRGDGGGANAVSMPNKCVACVSYTRTDRSEFAPLIK